MKSYLPPKAEKTKKMIYLYKNKNHFDVITTMPGFLGQDYYCHTCKKSYKTNVHPNARLVSKCCQMFPDKKKICNKCNRTFFGNDCFQKHLRNRAKEGKEDIVCKTIKKCLFCERNVQDLAKHECGFSTCHNCEEFCDMKNHKCFMQPKKCKGGNCTGCTEEKKMLFLQNANRKIHVLRF